MSSGRKEGEDFLKFHFLLFIVMCVCVFIYICKLISQVRLKTSPLWYPTERFLPDALPDASKPWDWGLNGIKPRTPPTTALLRVYWLKVLTLKY